MAESELHVPSNPIRVVTAASLFDGHDAAINIMRRILQRQGAEVIHLGHDRSVDDVVSAAVEEDAHAVAISSYQGGHVEYFSYLVDLLRERGAGHVRVYGGGGGVIVQREIDQLHAHGVARIFSPQDGQQLGLPGMINTIIRECDEDLSAVAPSSWDGLFTGERAVVARAVTMAEAGVLPDDVRERVEAANGDRHVPVLGITGTGGSGKSSLTDELVRRSRMDREDKLKVSVLAVDPTRRRGGGALLGDRIRMNALGGPVAFRSLANRGSGTALPERLADVIAVLRASGADLVIVETPGIGQGDAGIVEYADVSLYVMTPEFGAASQLEKIDMLDFADVVAINKFERRGGDDARRDVARQIVRNRDEWGASWEDMPVYGTSAATFHDEGVTALYGKLVALLSEKGLAEGAGHLEIPDTAVSTFAGSAIPADRERYLADVAGTVRSYHEDTDAMVAAARRRSALRQAAEALGDRDAGELPAVLSEAERALPAEAADLIDGWERTKEDYSGDELVVHVRDKELRTQLTRETLSGSKVNRVSLPRFTDEAEVLRFLRAENLPGHFPFTAGVFAFKREGEDPARMFAGEGDAFRTNRRFHYLSEDSPAKRLSTAFDSVTLYGRDPATPPDVYGKVGTSGVSIATLDDMKVLYSGFDLTSPTTSVSMTINGPAPTVLAFFLNTAIDQVVDTYRSEHGEEPSEEKRAELVAHAVANVRGTVQADILKEDQGQNTCIFSTEFSLRMMADIQEWFIAHKVRNFYSVSISGYHIAEAGANPISQLAFTLANGFTYVESYLARGMDIDDFAPNLSFFFSNGMDAEYSVIGRVARRIWAVAMRERYGANERSQKLKYHVQTSGRSLHAQEMQFNDIRTTLQALCALYDNANSLHTNAYDEAVTTPSQESVRRALAIQLIINREWGLSLNENPLQGSFVIEELTDLVEEAVLTEFDRIAERGGVLGAMETGYQRGKIQDESMLYEGRKHDGSLPIVGVNTFLPPADAEQEAPELELSRATEEEKTSQLQRLDDFQARHQTESAEAIRRLQDAATNGENVFTELMNAARVCSLGQLTDAFFEVGGQYRRSM
ncbi:fused isobutyryl-CoA mutase/GTPase IcmF [Actinomycetospora termitidis]|uniref:Fused isobutyryl-CoA mutase n=1 Tax=Actinomycetospora termitidis TaxID=3053470 RepID=A0ABT7MCZ2_9PSEU|nr:fused isobutyryl-CoA mutase/GTPase IcmF [Actinomycetospora sp. Odt1-22]MDL5158535.1 methylmalonyl-CoA mutase family protein [Actinomycetospora sp. Odt1-22]